MPTSLNAAVAAIASGNHGLVTRVQLLRIGVSERAIDARIARGALQVVHPTVYRIAGAPRYWEQDLLAAHLAAGSESAVSHLAAAVFHRFEGIAADRPHVVLPHEHRLRLAGVQVHRTRTLPACDVIRRRGLCVTSPERTLVDVAGLVRPFPLEIALDGCLRRQVTTLERIRTCLDARGPNGIRGWRILDGFVSERLGTAPTGSDKETAFRRGLLTRGLPSPVTQFTIRDDDDRFVARVDFAYPDIRLAIELDGSQHAYPTQRRGDLVRQNRLTLTRWRFVRFPTDPGGQQDALDTIETALIEFGELHTPIATVSFPKRLP
jgi:hypothetical protein